MSITKNEVQGKYEVGMLQLHYVLSKHMDEQSVSNKELSISVFDNEDPQLISEIRSGISDPIMIVWHALFRVILSDSEIFELTAETSTSSRQSHVLQYLRENILYTIEELSELLGETKITSEFIKRAEQGEVFNDRGINEIKLMCLILKLSELNNIDHRVILLYLEIPTDISFRSFLDILSGNEEEF